MARSRRSTRGPWTWLLVGLCVSACQDGATAPVAAAGGLVVRVGYRIERSVQYLSTQVAAVRLTITNVADQATTTYDDLSPTLIPENNGKGSLYSFTIQNLPAATYTATLTTFLDTGETQPIGFTTSAPFTVAANATSSLSVPNLNLDATPLGAWTVNSQVQTLLQGLTVKSYSYTLDETDGTSTTNSVKSSLWTQTHTWGNAIAFPQGVSTVSVTATAVDSLTKHVTLTATASATASIVAGATASSNVTLSF